MNVKNVVKNVVLVVSLILAMVPAVFSASAVTYKYGDADRNGKVSLADAILLQRYSAGNEVFEQEQQLLADVNGDLRVSILDVILLQRYCAGEIAQFPVEQNNTQPTTGISSQQPTDNDGWNEIVVKP